MTLTVVVGSSGSGKTTFLNDVHKSHKCIYIRQYHKIRPYLVVSKIPHFDPTQLPFWDTYVREGNADTVAAGGTMAGKFTAGLSGGQRKLLLFELVVQRVAQQSNNLLICLDEPFAGVTDDFVPFVVQRLETLRKRHTILLVTNDHVEALKELADHTITVSAVDRSKVQIDQTWPLRSRETAILALASDDKSNDQQRAYQYKATAADLRFFWDIEVVHNGGLITIAMFTVVCFALYMITFWNSKPSNAELVLIAGGVVNFFSANPYFVELTDWRITMSEETEALLHASKNTNKLLKTLLALTLFGLLSALQFGMTNAVIDGYSSVTFWVAMMMDTGSLLVPFILCGLYTHLPLQPAQIVSRLPFLCMIFFSTTFSPGAGISGLKGLRYLFPRFYFWCMVPSIRSDMENCPTSDALNLMFLVLAAMMVPCLFLVYKAVTALWRSQQRKQRNTAKKHVLMMDEEFYQLRRQLYGSSSSSSSGSIG
eukprot:scaffold3396_cov176-Amphora_coffeaeformis.AAC.7